MKTISKLFLATFCIILLMGFTGVHAQITDERDIPSGYKPIYTIEDLYGINNNLSGYYILMEDIDMSSTAPGGDWDTGRGWTPIGLLSGKNYFYGKFDGNGHKISNLNIYGDYDYCCIGLFGCLRGSVENLGLENINYSFTAKGGNCGGIAGRGECGSIANCYCTGNITAVNTSNVALSLSGLYSGGMNAENLTWDSGVVHAENCYSLVDINAYGEWCYCSGVLTNGDLAYSYASSIKNCYALSKISGGTYVYPVAYTFRMDTVKDNYYLNKYGTQDDAVGLTEAQMKLANCYTGFDFEKIWFIDSNSSYPYPQLYSCLLASD